jgi:hypothetical protein
MGVSVKELENFIVTAQPDLETIRRELNAFNIFNVLGVQYREIRHSNYLGWLFDPNESHQLGDVFLKGLFKVMRDCDVLDAHEYVQLLLKDVSGTKVYRESVHNIDILIVNKQHSFVIVIENKIYAQYSTSQLEEYYEYVEKNYADFKRIYLTLTPKAGDSHLDFDFGEYYTNINYQNIIDLLETKQAHIKEAHSSVKESINQYIAMVKKNITKSSKEVALAKEIYKNYKKEIDFIVSNQENFSNYRNEIFDLFNDGVIEGVGISHRTFRKKAIYLLPTDIRLRHLFYFPEAKSRNDDYIFSLVLYLNKDSIILKFGFGNIEESENREEIQTVKEVQFEKMIKFKCFDNPDFNFLFYDNPATATFADVASITLFDNDVHFESENDLIEAFVKKFEEINEELIQPWAMECIEKLAS